jgi:hypothetical protein
MKQDLPKKIEDALNSLDGIKRAEANPYLYSKIHNRLQGRSEVAPQELAWRLVIALFVVALVNVFTIKHLTAKESGEPEGAEMIANEYAISLPQTY